MEPVAILKLVHLVTFVTPGLINCYNRRSGAWGIVPLFIGIVSIPLNPLLGVVFPFVVLNSMNESDPSWCCWPGSDASAMGGIQFLMISNAVLYLPSMICLAAMLKEFKDKRS